MKLKDSIQVQECSRELKAPGGHSRRKFMKVESGDYNTSEALIWVVQIIHNIKFHTRLLRELPREPGFSLG